MSWSIIVVVENMLTKPKPNLVQLLHTRVGSVAMSTLRSVLAPGIPIGTNAKLAGNANHFAIRVMHGKQAG